MRPIVVSRSAEVILPYGIIMEIASTHAIFLCLGRVTVSVLKLNSHSRIIFVSEIPPSANTLSPASIPLQGIGSLTSGGQAQDSIAMGIAVYILIALSLSFMSPVRPTVSSM